MDLCNYNHFNNSCFNSTKNGIWIKIPPQLLFFSLMCPSSSFFFFFPKPPLMELQWRCHHRPASWSTKPSAKRSSCATGCNGSIHFQFRAIWREKRSQTRIVFEPSLSDLRRSVANPTKPMAPMNSTSSNLSDPTIFGVNRRRRRHCHHWWRSNRISLEQIWIKSRNASISLENSWISLEQT